MPLSVSIFLACVRPWRASVWGRLPPKPRRCFALIDGQWDWASETLQVLPTCVKGIVHFIAAHEQRRNFPITRIKAGQGKVTEVLYPGVHSNIGGGYQPGAQGRGIWNGQAEMTMLLSQIPLAHMHRAASAAGAPLFTFKA